MDTKIKMFDFKILTRIKMRKELFFLLTMALGLLACDPDIDDKTALGDLPSEVTFSVTPDPVLANTFILKNETAGAFIYQWDLGNGIQKTGESISAFYQKKGDYSVKLTVANNGGYASGTKTISVSQDAALDCDNNEVLKFLSNCNTKTWKLNPDKGALWVGPADLSQTWWQNELTELAVRPCAWNDEWTFNSDLSMIYDTKGDMWAEDYMGFNFLCINENELSEALKPWASGNHHFSIDNSVSPPTITLQGLGAYIGLPKVGNGAELKAPVASTTYTITQFKHEATRDFLELTINFGAGVWRFQLVSK